MTLNTNAERRKYERLFSPEKHWIFYKENGKRRGAYSKKFYKTKKSAEEKWALDNADTFNKFTSFSKNVTYGRAVFGDRKRKKSLKT